MEDPPEDLYCSHLVWDLGVQNLSEDRREVPLLLLKGEEALPLEVRYWNCCCWWGGLERGARAALDLREEEPDPEAGNGAKVKLGMELLRSHI